jgi:hypothetical protein
VRFHRLEDVTIIEVAAVGRVLRDLLAHGVQRLRQIIGAPLDVSPPGASATLIASCRAEPLA